MPQALLPIIPDGATTISERISVVKEDQQWTYFCGVAPVFVHPEGDRASFRMFTSQLICQGACKQGDIVRAFGVSATSVRRNVDKYEQHGVAGFFQPRKSRGATVLTADVLEQAQLLLSQCASRRQVAEQLQYESSGELGKLMGLDRVPEVRCLRNKLSQLSAGDAPDQWAGLLSQQWLEADPERSKSHKPW